MMGGMEKEGLGDGKVDRKEGSNGERKGEKEG